MVEKAGTLGGQLLEVALMSVPLVIVMILLADRQSREAALRGAVMSELPSWGAGRPIAVQVSCSVLSRAIGVAIDLGACSVEDCWDVVGRLHCSLPSCARLVVKGAIEGGRRATFIEGSAAKVERPRLARL